MRGCRRARRRRSRPGIVPISRPCLSFVSAWCTWIKAFLRRRHPCALRAPKRRPVGIALLTLGVLAVLLLIRLRSSTVCARFLGPRRLHLLPRREDIRARLGVLCSCVWSLRGWRGSEVIAREPVGAGGIGGMLLRRRRPLLLGRWSGWGRAVVGSALVRCGVGIARRWRRPGSRGVRRVRRDIQVALLPALGVVLGSLCLVAENLMRRLDLLEPDDELGLASRIAVGVVLQRQSSESLPNLILAGVGRHLEIGVVVASGISFGHGDG
jgi:hypothetical protein